MNFVTRFADQRDSAVRSYSSSRIAQFRLNSNDLYLLTTESNTNLAIGRHSHGFQFGWILLRRDLSQGRLSIIVQGFRRIAGFELHDHATIGEIFGDHHQIVNNAPG